ncbi:hypothetical protein QOZ51_30205, partial [Pseudomonas aeruginosa]|uniref:hypothetical protein n=1 Tax=Pseudomonas aeruginosa TaxID=287 RepID=UPI003458A03B
MNIHIFIAVQYLTGRKSVNPIMREQTDYAFMFHSITKRTVQNLYESFGELFGNEECFRVYFQSLTKSKAVAP